MMPYYAQYDSEGGRVEAQVAVVGTQGPNHRIVEWLEGPLHEARTVVSLEHLRYEEPVAHVAAATPDDLSDDRYHREADLRYEEPVAHVAAATLHTHDKSGLYPDCPACGTRRGTPPQWKVDLMRNEIAERHRD
jgi:hypothetical protein